MFVLTSTPSHDNVLLISEGWNYVVCRFKCLVGWILIGCHLFLLFISWNFFYLLLFLQYCSSVILIYLYGYHYCCYCPWCGRALKVNFPHNQLRKFRNTVHVGLAVG